MHAGDWIAGYAAIVATSALAWQFVTYWRARLPNLHLSLEPAIIVTDDVGSRNLLALYEGRTVEPVGIEWFFDLRITNRGRVRVQVTGIRISQGSLGWDAQKRAQLPLGLEPGEEKSFRFTDDDLDGRTLAETLDIAVSVSAGKEFKISGSLLGQNAVVISTVAWVTDVAAKAGLADKLRPFVVQQLADRQARP